MIENARHKDTGAPIGEEIAKIPNELSHDAVGLWHIEPTGRVSFGLKDDALVEFVRLTLRGLLDAGAVPVKGAPGSGYEWIRQRQYGTSRDEIVEAVIKEWLSLPQDSMVLAGEAAWFARPDPDFPQYVKMD